MNIRSTHLLLKLFIATSLLVSAAHAAEPASTTPLDNQRVFVCGHSFHIYIARFLPELAKSANINHIAAGQQMLGGSRTIQHWNLPDAQNKAKAALRAGTVDVLTLSPHALLPDEGIDNFTKLGLEKNPKLRVFVQASWPARDGVAQGKPFTLEQRNDVTLDALSKMREGHSTWINSLQTQVQALNKSVGHDAVFIVPVSDAVFALRKCVIEGKAPGIKQQTELFRDVLGHPQPPIALLCTYCHFVSIYHRSPVGLPVPAMLKDTPQSEQLNRLLQQIAWDTVSTYPMGGIASERPSNP